MFKVGDRVETLSIGLRSRDATVVADLGNNEYRVAYDAEDDRFFMNSGRIRDASEMTLLEEPADITKEFFR